MYIYICLIIIITVNNVTNPAKFTIYNSKDETRILRLIIFKSFSANRVQTLYIISELLLTFANAFQVYIVSNIKL